MNIILSLVTLQRDFNDCSTPKLSGPIRSGIRKMRLIALRTRQSVHEAADNAVADEGDSPLFPMYPIL